MNFILYLVITTYFCFHEVNCRSLQMDDDSVLGSQARDDKYVNHDAGISGIFSWIRLKPILRREVQRITNVKDKEANKLNKESSQTTVSVKTKDDGNLPSKEAHVHINDDISMKGESQIINTTNSIQSELVNNSRNEEATDESDVTDVEMLELNDSLVTTDFSDNVISDILNQTGDSIIFQALNDNISTVDSSEFDETSLLSGGGHIATLQEVSTIGFELLIDSETKQNLLLTELLSTQSDLTDEDDDFTNDDSSFITLGLSESGVEDTATNEERTDNLNLDVSTDEVEIEDTEFNTSVIEYEYSELNLTDTIKNVNASEVLNTEANDPKCPDPGWCVFWFMALDTCAKDSHCHGSLVCCMVGCSKTCVDAENELP